MTLTVWQSDINWFINRGIGFRVIARELIRELGREAVSQFTVVVDKADAVRVPAWMH